MNERYDGMPSKWPDETEAQYLERVRQWANRNGDAAKLEAARLMEERTMAQANAERMRAQRLRRDEEQIEDTSLGFALGTAMTGMFDSSSSDASSADTSSSSDFSGGGGDFGGGGSDGSY